jgi:single-stranded-DNA-specific exonuclease
MATLLARRGAGIPSAARAFLDPSAYAPASPTALPGLSAAADRLQAAIRGREPICVWGDFDVDGQTATTLLVSALTSLGATVTYHIPVRATEGHGVNLPVLAQIIDAGARLILTCDTGISAIEAAGYARARGVDLVITDHHDPPARLPDAYAIVNPKLADPAWSLAWQTPGTEAVPSDALPPSPLSSLPGVGVAYELAEELSRRSGRPEAAAGLLDLVALGIVADLAEVRADTRYLLQRGLRALHETRRLGLQVLMDNAELSPTRLSEDHIGFVIAPRLNALGRLADANASVEFLTTTDLTQARLIAADLEALNGRRKLLCDQVDAAAEAQLQRDPALQASAALVLAGPGWEPGVVGIVASRLAERHGRPVVLLALPAPGSAEVARGSARSVAGINITAAIASQAALLQSYGGHPMAAGLSLAPDRVPEFRRGLVRAVEGLARQAEGAAGLLIDGELSLSDLSLDLAAEIEQLAPFGPGNPAPVWVSRGLAVRGGRALGRDGAHRLVIVEDAWGAAQEVIWWDGAGEPLPEGSFDLAYTVRSSDYRGVRGIQVTWVDARPTVETAVEVRLEIEVVDYRGVAQPAGLLEGLRAQEDVAIWAEGAALTDQGAGSLLQHGSPVRLPADVRSRYDLAPASRLAIWTAPPGPQELAAVLRRVRPEKVYLFGVEPGYSAPEAFLRRLAGLVKHALSGRPGGAHLAALAAATAAREATVRAGLAWLAARGLVSAAPSDDGFVRLTAGDGVVHPDLAQAAQRLEALLAETAAYRAYFGAADALRLIAGAARASDP